MNILALPFVILVLLAVVGLVVLVRGALRRSRRDVIFGSIAVAPLLVGVMISLLVP